MTKLIWSGFFEPGSGQAWNLIRIMERSVFLYQIRKEDLRFGDLILISTMNSKYSVYVLDDNFYLVYGGWFDKKRLSPIKIQINGCTWGGSAIIPDIIAACGMHLEFRNGPITSNIQEVMVIQHSGKN